MAQAQIDLVRVRRARNDLTAVTLRDLAGGAQPPVADTGPHAAPFDVSPMDVLHLHVPDLATRLAAMDRYERRALSRRKFAIRAFSTAGR